VIYRKAHSRRVYIPIIRGTADTAASPKAIFSKAAVHDLGAASASLTLEATARGLSVHQMIGIDPDKAREVFAVEDPLEPLTGLAIGYAGTPAVVPKEYAQRDERPRERKSLQDILIAGEP